MQQYKRESNIKIGCVADDFTGAGDAASFLQKGGLKTLLLMWPVQREIILDEYDAVVVALKSRSIAAEDAVRESLETTKWLIDNGVEKIYFKYCSTFDSTRDGNIGPVCDALLETLEVPYTILCPALISNGRIVKDGKLFVNGAALAESHMKNHPLNPMWDSSIKKLMEPQSKYPCIIMPESMYTDREAVSCMIKELEKKYKHFYLIPDYFDDSHGMKIVSLFKEIPLWSGGSGLLEHYARSQCENNKDGQKHCHRTYQYGRLMFAGSCSAISRKQITEWIQTGGYAVKIEPEMLSETETDYIEELKTLYLKNPSQDILYYSSERSGNQTDYAQKMECFIASLAKELLQTVPVERLIVAGGETSGAVIKKVGYKTFIVGEAIAPGVPILYPLENKNLEIVLKSGNFGNEKFFIETLKE